MFTRNNSNHLNLCSEINDGVPVSDEDGNVLGNSAIAAKSGITQVVFSRVGMASPGMGRLNKSI